MGTCGRRLLPLLFAVLVILGCACPETALAQTDAESTAQAARQQALRERSAIERRGDDFVTPATQLAIDRGLAYLAEHQHADGSFGSGSIYRRNVAVTALGGMAFLSAGHVPGRGQYADNVERAVQFLLDSSQPSGYILREDSASHGPMYGHGFATLFLAEIYGMSPKPEVRDKLKAAIQLIVNSQNREGGWRYNPDSRDADVSVTVCQMMALRAARNAGISVPKTTVDACIEYVRRCQNSDGGFRYQLQGRPHSEFPRTAAGVVTLYSAGFYEGPEIDNGLEYLIRFPPAGDFASYEAHYYYGHYYAAQAMWQAGGARWEAWFPQVRGEFLARQAPDGSWPDTLINPEYATAMACLVLQMPNNVLPIFQR